MNRVSPCQLYVQFDNKKGYENRELFILPFKTKERPFTNEQKPVNRIYNST